MGPLCEGGCIITKDECEMIRKRHLDELENLKESPRLMVYGNIGGKLSVHQRRLGKKNLEPIVNALKSLLKKISSYEFSSFEDVYDVVGKEVIAGKKWKNPILLHYDIALRLAYSLSKSGKNLMPRDYLYLHAAPYNSAKILARAINEKSPVPGRQSGDYLSQIFGCGSCDPAHKEHILCDKHKEIEDPEKLQLLLKRCFSED